MTICQKGYTDHYHMCHCYDSNGAIVRDDYYEDGNRDKIVHYCCQCPERIVEKEYKKFEVMRKVSHFIILLFFFFARKSRLETALREKERQS